MMHLRPSAEPIASANAPRPFPLRIGLAGTGTMARGFWLFCQTSPDLRVERVLTRRPLQSVIDAPHPERLTNSLAEFLDGVDLVVEMSGDVGCAARTIAAAFDRSLPVVTLNPEFHVTVGSYFVGRGVLSEADGDQPGCLASLREEAIGMGFRPLVYGNLKGFLNLSPTPADMQFWSSKQGIAVRQTTSFTDGTKVQIEQALVANGLDAVLARPGLLGFPTIDVQDGGRRLAAEARRLGRPISDYLLSAGCFPGVFIVAEHDDEQRSYLQYLKLGAGPDYFLPKQYHLCHLEVGRTVRRIASGGPKLLDNAAHPNCGVLAIAKRELEAGMSIARGIGSFDLRGSAVPYEQLRHFVPIGLLEDVRLTRTVEAGEPLPWDAVEGIDESLLRIWQSIVPATSHDPGTTPAAPPLSLLSSLQSGEQLSART